MAAQSGGAFTRHWLRHARTRRVLAPVVLALVYAATARLSLLFAFAGTNASPVWPATGIAISALALWNFRLWPAITAGAFAANVLAFSAGREHLEMSYWLASMSIAMGNTCEAMLGAWLLRRGPGFPNLLDSLRGVLRLGAVVLVSCAVSAAIGSASLWEWSIVPGDALRTVSWTWWLGDVCGALLVVPFVVAFAAGNSRSQPPGRVGFAGALVACVAALGAWLFLDAGTSDAGRFAAFLLLPMIAFAALHKGARGSSTVVLMIAAFAVACTVGGKGPFSGGSANDALVLLDTFLLLCASVGMALSADQAERCAAASRTSLHTPVRRDATAWAALLCALALTIVGWDMATREIERESRDRFENLARLIESRLQTRMQEYERVLHGAVGLFAASAEVGRESWMRYVASQDLPNNLPGIRGVAFAQRVRNGDLRGFERKVKHEGYAAFSVHPGSSAPDRLPILYSQPFHPASVAFGFDILTEPVRARAAEEARDTGHAILTSKLQLMRDAGDAQYAGFLLILPVYVRGQALDTVAHRRDALRGVVFSPFRAIDLMREILSEGWPEVRLQLFDGSVTTPGALLYSDSQFAISPDAATERATIMHTTRVIGHEMSLRFQPSPEYLSSVDRQEPQLVFVCGTLLSLLLFGALRTQARMVERAGVLAERITRDLAQSEARNRLLYEASPAMLHSFDGDGRIVAASDAWLQKLGYARAEVIGRHSSDFFTEPTRKWAREVVFPLLARNGRCTNIDVQLLRRDGGIVEALLSAVVLPGERPASLAFLEDVTDRRRAEREAGAARAEVWEASERLAAIVDSSGEAIISESLDGCIATWNRGAETLFGYRADEVVGGRVPAMLPPEKAAEDAVLVARVQRGETVLQYHTRRVRRDGTPLDVTLTLSPIHDADGKLAGISRVVRDVTPQRMLREMQARQSAILQSAGVSIISTDPRGIVRSFNSEAERMLGYRGNEIVGSSLAAMVHVAREIHERARQLTAELGTYVAGNHEALFARARRGGVDQREWTYVRRDGSTFPVALSVSATHAGDGQVDGFICVAIDISARRAHEELQRTAIQEKETLLKEVYHRVKNNLQVVSSLFSLQLRFLPEGAPRAILQQSSERVRAIALVHDKLCRSNNLESIDIVSYVQDLCATLAAAHGAAERGISLAIAVEPVAIGLEASVPLGLLLNELISNSFQHAFPDGRRGTVTVRLCRGADGFGILEVMDDGVGFTRTPGADGPRSLGLRLVTTLARQLGGTLTVEPRSGGSCTALVFDIDSAARPVVGGTAATGRAAQDARDGEVRVD